MTSGGYVGLSIATLLSQHHKVTAVDIIPEKVELINNKKSPIQDEYIEKYLAEKELDLTATLDAKEAYSDADFVVIAAPTNYDSKKNFFDTKTIRNLVNIMAAHEQQIGRAIRIDAGRTGQYCQVVNHRFLDRLNREKPTTMRKLEDIWYEGNGSSWENRNAHYNSSRYHMLNLHATFTKGTIEFRLFQFADPADGKRNGLHAGEMKAYIQLCLAMSQLAKMVRTASPKPQQTDNEKYAMRCWMLRLGFIGDEFATARHSTSRCTSSKVR